MRGINMQLAEAFPGVPQPPTLSQFLSTLGLTDGSFASLQNLGHSLATIQANVVKIGTQVRQTSCATYFEYFASLQSSCVF